MDKIPSDGLSDLIVIEAPGKIRTVQKLARQAGMASPHSCATFGILLDLPEGELGLELQDWSPHYVARNSAHVANLKHLAAAAGTIWVATDNDIEGEVIAAQVFATVKTVDGHGPVYRMRLEALTLDAFRREMEGRETALDTGRLRFGMARRVADRLIAYGFSDQSLPKASGIVGRVQSSVLHALTQKPAATLRVAGLADGWQVSGRFLPEQRTAVVDAVRYLNAHAGELGSLPITSTPTERCPPQPFDAAGALVEGALALRMSVAGIAELLQDLYQVGDITYWRTDNTFLTEATQQLGVEMAAVAGLPVAERLLASAPPVPLGQMGHGALAPTHTAPLADPRSAKSPQEAMLALLGRRLVASVGQPVSAIHHRIDPEALSSWIEAQTGASLMGTPLEVVRWEYTKGRAPWRQFTDEAWLASEVSVETVPVDVAVLEAMVEAGLGRPSTYVGHISKLVQRGWISHDGKLSLSGRGALKNAEKQVGFLFKNGAQDIGLTVLRDRFANVGNPPTLAATIAVILEALNVPTDEVRKRLGLLPEPVHPLQVPLEGLLLKSM